MFQDAEKQTRPEPFDLARSPLKGLNLIDASAGTGKTYTICALVLRLLLEKDLSIDQILVVTYTEAATEDLRDRIRKKLRQALVFIASGKDDDDFLRDYLGRFPDLQKAEKRCRDALRGFDEAAIFTIHGFCQRQLLENSFESSSLFDAELVTDDSRLVREIVEDFWRRNFSRTSYFFSEHVQEKLSPKKLLDFLNPFIPRPSLYFIPVLEPAEACSGFRDTEAEYAEAYRKVCTAWRNDRGRVARDLHESEALKRNKYRIDRLPEMLAGMDEMTADLRPGFRLPDDFLFFTRSSILAAARVRKTPNILPFYELCEQMQQLHTSLANQYDRCLLALKRQLASSFRDEFDRRKKEANIYSFDDLLQGLHQALSGPGGSAFAAIIAAKYPAVLIDEFQDTDPRQFEIFSTLHRAHSTLFLIGDPKQAIYSFRGADIFTYMDAAASRPLLHYTLNVNYRSTALLVKAVNTLFGRSRAPFVFDAIPFQPVAAGNSEPARLTFDGRMEEPFILWGIQNPSAGDRAGSTRGDRQKPMTKTEARGAITAAVAAEVSRLLGLAEENRVCLNGKKLQRGDIAILVRKNHEARKMRQALTRYRIPSVVHSAENLFQSEEAAEMLLLLDAAAAPHDIRKIKTALLTRMVGLSAGDIELYGADVDNIIELHQRQFKTYHELWNRFGFIRMFWTLVAENRIRPRMLALENGERVLTNILHLAEVLHQEAVERDMDMTSLLDYLQNRLADEPDENPEHQLRLESDADRVKIVTIHKAKGLEYPVVFCPFTWEGTRLTRQPGCIFHRHSAHEGGHDLIYDVGSPELEKHLELAGKEELAENLRLLYVAVTRAIHRCYLAWGLIRGAETSAPAYLLHQDIAAPGNNDMADAGGNQLIDKTVARYRQLSEEEFAADLDSLAAASEGTIRILPGRVPAALYPASPRDETPMLKPRKFSAEIATDWKISSFSSLTASMEPLEKSGYFPEELFPGQDESPLLENQAEEAETEKSTEKPPEQQMNIFSFPHGPRAGIMLHELLEQVDFSMPDRPATAELIDTKLRRHGYDPAWQPVIAEMLADLGGVSLHKDIPGLNLATIPAKNLLHELEFYFPLADITPEKLKTLFQGNVLPGMAENRGSPMEKQLERLTFSPARGFMKGFIDLVFEFKGRFYLIDWKSNFLGHRAGDYRHDRLQDAVYAGFYFLQYHLYCLALHLYLGNRLPEYGYEKHFGGVFYIFLRGVKRELGPDYGIFFDRPARSMVENLSGSMVPGSGRKV